MLQTRQVITDLDDGFTMGMETTGKGPCGAWDRMEGCISRSHPCIGSPSLVVSTVQIPQPYEPLWHIGVRAPLVGDRSELSLISGHG